MMRLRKDPPTRDASYAPAKTFHHWGFPGDSSA